MLQLKSQGKIVERIVRTKTGEFALAVFYVVERNGEILNVRLLRVSPISGSENASTLKLESGNCSFLLPGFCLKSPTVISYKKKFTGEVSPFFNIFQFLVSQPTRAPSCSF
ncbi:MAG: hypothetical protein EXS59_00390 [Candidatus Taylorbacteria bacterium]|nr:hypothetical protein [Candidatus Taylorbacteria bacterium]